MAWHLPNQSIQSNRSDHYLPALPLLIIIPFCLYIESHYSILEIAVQNREYGAQNCSLDCICIPRILAILHDSQPMRHQIDCRFNRIIHSSVKWLAYDVSTDSSELRCVDCRWWCRCSSGSGRVLLVQSSLCRTQTMVAEEIPMAEQSDNVMRIFLGFVIRFHRSYCIEYWVDSRRHYLRIGCQQRRKWLWISEQ